MSELRSAAEADIGERVGIKLDDGTVHWGTIKVVEHFIEFDNGAEEFFDLRHLTKEGRVCWKEDDDDDANTNKSTIAHKRKPDENDRAGKGRTTYADSRKKTRNNIAVTDHVDNQGEEATVDVMSNQASSSAINATSLENEDDDEGNGESSANGVASSENHAVSNGHGKLKSTAQKDFPIKQEKEVVEEEQTDDEVEVIEYIEIIEDVDTHKTESNTESLLSNGPQSAVTVNPKQVFSATSTEEEHVGGDEQETNGTHNTTLSNGDEMKSISQVIISSTTSTTKDEVVDVEDQKDNESDGNPETVSPTNYASLIHHELQKDDMDHKIKQEGDTNTKSTLTNEERQKAKARLEQWIQANTAPDGSPRYVFRLGCSAEHNSITTILGGSAMNPWHKVIKVPGTNKESPDTEQWTGSPNKFIEPGQFYVAGNDAWNPFGPQFPGDTGLINLNALELNEEQEEFHFFIECSSEKHLRHWHGQEAVGGRLYVGVYRKVEDALEIGVFFKDLEYHHRRAIADHMRWGGSDYFAMMRTKVNELHREAAMDIFEDEWQDFSQEQKDTHAILVMLEVIDYQFDFVPVEQVRYDEELYAALVACGATNKENARVSLDPMELGFPNLLEP